MNATWTDKDYSIFVQSLCRHWIGVLDDSETVKEKVQFCFWLATEGLRDGKPSFAMSKVAETKIVNAMESAIAAEDWPHVWEVWMELNEQEQEHMNSVLDRHRRKEWKEAITKGAAAVNSAEAPEPPYIPLRDL
jgi:hypothetical protein